MIDHSVQGYKGSLSSLKLTNLNSVSLRSMSTRLFEEYDDSCPYIMWNLLVARFHTCANLYWQLFWQNYTVLGSNFQVSAKTRHFYYHQPFPFPLRLKELFLYGKYLYLMIVLSTRWEKEKTFALLQQICTTLTFFHYCNIFALL